MKYLLNLSPTEDQLLEIKTWLSQELEETGEGFMHNWNIIEDYFDRDQLITVSNESQTIGFMTWNIIERIVLNIDIAAIQPNQRFKGAGKFLIEEAFKYFKSLGLVVAKLFCQPRSSEQFWKRLGFIDMPELGYLQHELSLYCPLINLEAPKTKDTRYDVIELWNCEPYRATLEDPEWKWRVELSNNKLVSPILAPGSRDWNIRWSKNGEIIKESKVKYFSKDKPIDYSNFIFIEELKYP